MNKRKRSFAVFAAAVLAAAGILTAPSVAQAETAPNARGCPLGAFCIYPQNAYWNNNHPSYVFYMTYPANQSGTPHVWYNLKNQIGTHKVYNNTGCSTVEMNLGYNGAAGTLHPPYVWEGQSYDWDLTRYNSVTLWDDWTTLCHTR